MWTRGMLKKNAKENLKQYFWMALGVSAVAFLLDGTEEGVYVDYGGAIEGFANFMTIFGETSNDLGTAILLSLGLSIFCVAIGLCLNMLVYSMLCGPILVGKHMFYLRARQGDVRFGNLFSSFRDGRYTSIAKTMFFHHLYITLWGLLFVIPGIAKNMEYFLVPYLIAENPKLSWKRASEISSRTMDGEKWNLFVLQLSFLGWYILGALCCCVGTYAVQPYEHATYAEFYTCMRAKMMALGITDEAELSGEYEVIG
ncbi:MAG: DUF975 family protein [Oscillospiraceae bacterium]|nr:DUF975 family protein [Oscillospiraceae bacterium]